MKLSPEYKCSTCGLHGCKLWRDYGYADEPRGPLDMMTLGLSGVAAIPVDDDCDSYQSAGAYKSEGLLWWHNLPTHIDDSLIRALHREIATIVHTMRHAWETMQRSYKRIIEIWEDVQELRRRLGLAAFADSIRPEDPTKDGYGYQRNIPSARAMMLDILGRQFNLDKLRMDLYERQGDLEWRLNRRVIEIKKPTSVVIWGSKTVVSGEWTITGGEEQTVELEPGQRIAIGRNQNAVLLLGEKYRECPSIMSHDRNGDLLADDLLKRGLATTVNGRY